MVWFTPKYGKGTVELLGKNRADHLVGESHHRKSYAALSPGADLLRETVGASDGKQERFPSRRKLFLKPGCKLSRTELLSVFVKQD